MANKETINKLLISNKIPLEVTSHLKKETTFSLDDVKKMVYYSFIAGQDETLKEVLKWFKDADSIDTFYNKLTKTLDKRTHLLD